MKKLLLLLSGVLLITVHFSFAQYWTPLTSGTNAYFYNVQFPSQNIGFASGDGGLYKTVNGYSWQHLTGINTGLPFYFTNTQTGCAFTVNGLEKTTDGGTSWIPVGFVPTNIIIDMHFLDNNNGFACGRGDLTNQVIFMKTTDGGSNWSSEIPLTDGYSEEPNVFFTSATTGFIGTDGLIFKTTDGGNNWIADTLGDPLNNDFLFVWDLHFPTADTGYACGMGSVSQIFKTTDAGETWTGLNTSQFNTYPFSSVFFTSADTGFAATGDGAFTGAIIKTVDGGATWSMSYNNTEYITSLDFPTSNTGYAAGANGAIYKYSRPTGIEETEMGFISIYPNPANELVDIAFQPSVAQSVNINIIDSFGRVVWEKEEKKSNVFNWQLPVSGFADGIYTIKIKSENGIMKISKLIVY